MYACIIQRLDFDAGRLVAAVTERHWQQEQLVKTKRANGRQTREILELVNGLTGGFQGNAGKVIVESPKLE